MVVEESTGDGDSTVSTCTCINTSGSGDGTTQCRRRPWSDLPNDILISIASLLGRVECTSFMTLCKEWLRSIKLRGHGNGETTKQCRCHPWSDLPNDILFSIASRLGRVECIRFMSVCKGWLHSIKPHGHRNDHLKPCLLAMEDADLGWLSLYTPFPNSKTYKLRIPELKQTSLRFSKDGWILLSKSSPFNSNLFLLNMLTGAKFDLPYMVTNPNAISSGICFTSTPGSSDFMVVFIRAVLDRVTIFTYRPSTDLKEGEEQKWTEECYKNSSRTSFLGVSCNPIFYKGKLYCLDRFGHLGVFDPVSKNWTTCDRPEYFVSNPPPPNLNSDLNSVLEELGVPPEFRDFPYESFMVDLDGDLISVFVNEGWKTTTAEEVHVFRLDCCKMGWEKVDSLGTRELFVGLRTSISTVEVPYGSWNKLYFPACKPSHPTVEVPYGSWKNLYFPARKPNPRERDVIFSAYSLETKAYDHPYCSNFKRDLLRFIWIELPMSKWESIFHSKWKRV